jgi:hypothetical protein
MKTYRIVGVTNPYIGSKYSYQGWKRYENANGTYYKRIIREHLTLKEAKKLMIDFYNEDGVITFPNWGLIVAHNRNTAGTDSDGLYFYEYDSRVYRIEEEN